MFEIKIGTWVTVNGGQPHQFKRFTGDSPNWNKSLDYENIEMLDYSKQHIPNYDRSIVKLWDPKEGEWCWYGGNICKILKPVPNDLLHSIRIWTDLREPENMSVHKSYIKEPFKGILPSFVIGE